MTSSSPKSIVSEFAKLFNPQFWDSFFITARDTAGHVVLILLVYALLRFTLRRLIGGVIVPMAAKTERTSSAAQAARVKTLAGLLNSIVSYLLMFVFGVMLLRAFNLDPLPLLTTASVAGLAVGFGAQKLVKDVISGFFILLENQYSVGDFVTIGSVTGVVETVGMRTTLVRDEVGKLYILSNGDITQVCNQSRGAVATFIEIGVAAATDIAKATEIIESAGADLMRERPDLDLKEAPKVQGLGAMDAAKITLRVTCLVDTPAHLTEAQLALRGLIYKRLGEASIAFA
ncbi:mechanosensitive ion channel protein MscS [Capsulimonas corticalis]|uniref:Mechanosensitive ion channel protein MscS n=1 Tax=Capsulimonas corticalis TaxID=2219043 RepID=A0A402CSC8_9BACT|nr:mechanosensitive ion channel domain-containing protein [Capsulimonas corticalis]BDI31130.1 mechanosensitive ion channel protein MscS [Capsulimonas corticalis]